MGNTHPQRQEFPVRIAHFTGTNPGFLPSPPAAPTSARLRAIDLEAMISISSKTDMCVFYATIIDDRDAEMAAKFPI